MHSFSLMFLSGFPPKIILLIANNQSKKIEKNEGIHCISAHNHVYITCIFKDHLNGELLPAYPEIIPFSAAGSKGIFFHKTQKSSCFSLSLF